jgi:hypothetical protein
VAPVLTNKELATFFKFTYGKVPIEVLVRHFQIGGRPGKLERLQKTLDRLVDLEVVVKHADGTRSRPCRRRSRFVFSPPRVQES